MTTVYDVAASELEETLRSWGEPAYRVRQVADALWRRGATYEEMTELREAVASANAEHIEEEMGDLLFAIAHLSRKLGIEPEGALRRANEKFTARFDAMEQGLVAEGRHLHDATLEELEARWQQVKRSPE